MAITLPIEMNREGIRLLGKADRNGKLIPATQTKGRQGTRLVPIEPKDIRKYLVMVYFLGYSEKQTEELVELFKGALGIELRRARDRYGREYWWRPISDDKDNKFDAEEEECISLIDVFDRDEISCDPDLLERWDEEAIARYGWDWWARHFL